MIRIASGEYCDYSYIEIEKIPDISILLEQTNTNADVSIYIEKFKTSFAMVLSEIYQITKEQFSADSLLQDNSFELLWYSLPVANQTYKAQIKLFLIIRSIGYDPTEIKNRLLYLKKIFSSSLSSMKYSLRDGEGEFPLLDEINRLHKAAIIKEDNIGNLQSYVMDQCYVYDKLPSTQQDFGTLIDFLSSTPNSAVSIQLIPTYYSYLEKSFIEKISGVLDTINRGVHDMMIGNVINPIAERYAAKYKYYEKHKDAALFCYNILVMSDHQNLMGLAAKMCGHIDGGVTQEDKISLRTLRLSHNELDIKATFAPLPWLLNDVVMDKLYAEYPIYYAENFDFRRISNVITSEECGEIFRLPIGTKYTTSGLKIDYTYKDTKEFHKKIVDAGDITVGMLKSSFDANNIGFSLKDINRHMLIVGVPGMGKTTYSIGLLHTLWEKHHIPFLVIEPAKSEYRAMVEVIPDLQIFTFNKNDISPMPINPFVPPKGVKIKQYKSVLKTAFSAGVSMAEALSKLFEETIDEVYSDFGWLDSDTIETGGEIFNIQDFALCFKKTFERHGYVGEAKNVGTAGLLRLVSMANLFGSYHSVPIEDMLSKPTVIELSAVQNKEEKSFIMALLLLNISAYIDNNYLGNGTLRNIVLIEEAHNLLATSDSNEEGNAKPNAVAQELIKNMLAEKRAQGLGLVIADQSPEKVGGDVIKLTNVKLGFNLVEKTDKEIFANSTNMDEKQIERMTQLIEGEAFFFMGGMSSPEEVAIPDYRSTHSIDVTISDGEVKQKTTYWKDKLDKLKPYPECAFNGYCGKACKLKEREIAENIARRIFNKYFTEKSNDVVLLRRVLRSLVPEIKDIINGKFELTKDLFFCVKIHLIRYVKYHTQTVVDKDLINEALSNGKK